MGEVRPLTRGPRPLGAPLCLSAPWLTQEVAWPALSKRAVFPELSSPQRIFIEERRIAREPPFMLRGTAIGRHPPQGSGGSPLLFERARAPSCVPQRARTTALSGWPALERPTPALAFPPWDGNSLTSGEVRSPRERARTGGMLLAPKALRRGHRPTPECRFAGPSRSAVAPALRGKGRGSCFLDLASLACLAWSYRGPTTLKRRSLHRSSL